MRRFLALVLILTVIISGCRNPNERFIGTWIIDAATVESPNVTTLIKASPEFKQEAELTRLEIKGDGTFSNKQPSGTSQWGTWTVTGNTLTVTTNYGVENEGSSTYVINANGSRLHHSQPMPGGKTTEYDLIRE